MAITFINTTGSLQAFIDKVKEWVERQPSVVFASTGQGIGSTAFFASVHKDYTRFAEFQRNFRRECGECQRDSKTFMLSLKGDVIRKHFSLNRLVDTSRNPL